MKEQEQTIGTIQSVRLLYIERTKRTASASMMVCTAGDKRPRLVEASTPEIPYESVCALESDQTIKFSGRGRIRTHTRKDGTKVYQRYTQSTSIEII